jgi:hypothetical protein
MQCGSATSPRATRRGRCHNLFWREAGFYRPFLFRGGSQERVYQEEKHQTTTGLKFSNFLIDFKKENIFIATVMHLCNS